MFSGVFLLVILLNNSDAHIQVTGSQMVVEQVKVLHCTFDLNSWHRGQIAMVHDWKQVYVDSTGLEQLMSHVKLPNGVKIVFSMELQKFDNNTDIYTSYYSVFKLNESYRYVDRVVHCAGANRKVINLVDDGYYQYQIDRTLLYDTTPVKFQCEVNDPGVFRIRAAWISTSGNRILTFNKSLVSLEPTVEHDGSMLCCIYYTYTTPNNTVHLQRFVKNITLLVYRKERGNTGNRTCATTRCISPKVTPNSITTNKTDKAVSTAVNGKGEISGNTDKTLQYTGKSNEASQQSGKTDKRQQDTGKTDKFNSQYSGYTNKTLGKSYESSQQSGKTDKTHQISYKSYESSQISGITFTRQQDSGKSYESSQQTGITYIRQQDSGKSNEASQQSGNTNNRQQNSGKTNEASQQSGNTDKRQQDSGKTNKSDKNTNTTDGINKNPDNEGREETDDAKNDYLIIIIITTLSAVMTVVLISIFAIKTRCWKKNGQSQSPRLAMQLPPTQPAPYTPFYENVALRGDCELQTQEEPQYEEVIYH